MNRIPKKVADRLKEGVKRMTPIVLDQRKRDVAEADTVTAVKDILEDVFGFNKYTELTGEHAIRGTFVDLVVKIEDNIQFLIEVKSAGTNLDKNHLRQARDYGANNGNEWIILTNGITWKVYRIIFGQPIETRKVIEFSLDSIDLKKEDDLQSLFLICKEALSSNAIEKFYDHSKLVNRFTVGQLLLSENVVKGVKKELKRIFDDIKITDEQLLDMIESQIIKREILDGENSGEATQLVRNATLKTNRAVAKKKAQKASAISKAEEDATNQTKTA